MSLPLAIDDAWPDSFDVLIIAGYVALVVAIPLAGNILMALDIRAHLRRLRGALIVISQYSRHAPAWLMKATWSTRQQPACLEAFDLRLPCTEADLLDAYRRRIKEVHPDRGGNRNEFLRLQRYFDEARSLLITAEE
ncbi:MAG: hypothetical protein ACR2NU_05185 [Aeoliella sp.]